MLVTSQDVEINVFREYGKVIVPKGTKLTNMTAMGFDPRIHFVDEFEWIDKGYPDIAAILKHDAIHIGINIPKDFVERI